MDNEQVAKELLEIAALLADKKTANGNIYSEEALKKAARRKVIDKIGDWELAIEARWGGIPTPIILKDGKEVDQLAPNLKDYAAKREFKKYVQKHGG